MRKYQSIQYLRAIAALIVVFHHARNPFPGLYNPLIGLRVGQAGVDIFFVISGFIMYSAARYEAPLEFMRRRLTRIAPLYFIATIILFLIDIIVGKSHLNYDIISDIIKSILFIPHFSSQYPGNIWPYLIPGWTLNYEMFFYVIFFIGLLCRRLIAFTTVMIIFFVAIGRVLKIDNALWWTYTNPLLLEFMAGVLIAKWFRNDVSIFWAILFPAGVFVIALSELTSGARVILWGIPAVMIVIGAVAIERNGRLPHWGLLAVLGDASYSIYLFQMVALGGVELLVSRLPLEGWPQLATMIGLGLLVATGLGLAAHYFLERPITRYLLAMRGREKVELPTAA